jgi:hypothetical protein
MTNDRYDVCIGGSALMVTGVAVRVAAPSVAVTVALYVPAAAQACDTWLAVRFGGKAQTCITEQENAGKDTSSLESAFTANGQH